MRFIYWRGLRVTLVLILMIGVFAPSNEARAQGQAISTTTKSGFLKSNQSKVFYHSGNWWAIAHHDETSRWYIWKFSGGTWTMLNPLVKSSTMKYDAVVNSASGKLYLIGSHASATEFRRYSYASGTATWTLDTGFPVSPSFNNDDGGNPLSLVQAKNGDLWIFRINSNKLQAKRSTNGGAAWSAAIDVKTGLTAATGTTDAVAFSSGGNDFVGVAYGETPAAGSQFGFLTHQDGAANETWTDESASLTLFGAERGSNQLAMTTDAHNNIYLFTKTSNAAGSDPRNTLYKRTNDGAWQKFKVNASAGQDWKSPAVVFEALNNKIYVMGINTASPQGEYKTCTIGQESTLQAEPVAVLFSSAGATFAELSAPPGGTSVDISTGLMVAADNSAASDIWYRLLPIVSATPVTIGAVVVNSNHAHANAAYTIPLTLSSNGALAAGAGILNFRFPAGTTVPSSIAASHVTVNGTPATTVVSNSVTREVLITTPVDLANSQSFSVAFALGAGIFNPAIAGDYTLQAWTSSQPTPAVSPIYTLLPSLGANPLSALTKSGYKKSNQSKVFYHDTQWWAVAFDAVENRWYIWKFTGTAWVKSMGIDKGAAFNYDVVVNASENKIYLLGAHKSLSKFHRYSYIGGAWKIDSGFPKSLNDFVHVDANNPINLVQARNGDLWMFRIRAGILQAKRSSDGGATWSAIIPVKTGLRTANGTTDAVAFKSGDHTYIGVGYGETDSLTSQFGFLMHQDGAADDAWTDESASLTSFGTERARNQISMAVDANNNVYIFTQNASVTTGNPHNTLYRRRNTGIWAKFKVNSAHAWKSPALAVDASGKALYLMGVNTATDWGEYKTCSFGQEATLDTMSAAGLFAVNGAKFDDLSAPAANVTASSGLMLCADNLTTNKIYFRYLELSGSTPLNIGAVEVVSNQINANANYTIPLKLSNLGALEAGVGVLNFIFPANTFVPNNMPATAVKVDGVPAATVISNNLTRQVTVVTPVNLPDDHSFSVVFDSAAGAGLLNPTTIGADYRLTAWTSSQPVQMKSPAYSLTQTTTTVTPATVAPFPTSPDSLADYTLTFNLGPRGRPIGGSSTIMIKFGGTTKVSNGSINGVKLNIKDAVATADSISRQVTVTIPVGLGLTNNSAVTLFIPRSKIRNPAPAGFYSLMVATSVETTFVASQQFEIKASNTIGAPIPGTKKSFDRNNQSKVFYHGGFWWVAAQARSDLKWYLWKFNGLIWTQNALIHSAGKSRPDCVLDAPANKVYIVLPGAGTTYITRLSYAAATGNWSTDSGYPVLIPDFAQVSDKAVNLTRAKNGHFWVFRVTDSTLTAKRSGDLGRTWSPLITVKKKLHNGDGLTDATAFTLSSGSYIGVGYAENSAPGSIYGFLRHLDTDPDSVWTDETALMPQFPGTVSDDHVSMITYSGEVLMLVKTNGGSANVINVGLMRRATNGAWSLFPVLLSAGWTRPVMAIDQSNNRLYLFGTREGTVKVGEMKSCAIGDYGSLLAAKIDTVFKNGTDNFFNASVPFHTVNRTTNLLICNGNESRDELWYNLIKLDGAPKMADEATTAGTLSDDDVDGVQVFPNPFNPQTSFRFKVKENSAVKLQIFNLAGQLVRTIADEDLAPGVYVRRWNGRNQNGRPAASGLYFYRLQIGQQIMNGRIQLLK
ncbi:MAG: T9SS type A sorting domain-containing protein [candidate division KSB1 bacterium]|nr:T9SS type A sorting domain-containing protein [candidate division KSB1 bacterium]MDZ7365793.1 T9SS type A sorting domain-containing protein [candidate division KSB1 bacterium]MDZ7403728.1 T9SS type A sorting domain-containing protein [candidate division KSB1 bacterium]